MGFEQLAALKAKLTEQAKSEARAKTPRPRKAPAEQAKSESRAKTPRPRQAPASNPATRVDPVVHTIGKLQKQFPKAFPKNPAPKVPLKIGIFEDLLTHAKSLSLTEAELRDAIRTWCRGARYWACLTEGAQRVDLAGQEVGSVTEADARRGQQLRAGRAKPAAAPSKDTAPDTKDAAPDA
ncbi:ProQ/FinO family protein [Cupriavidus sp. BIS7]|uniref:ProQ/FinO family protein n=1 Tax=Cupriavidus sp. BIS7 TaxID=1217718 RepID=UPI0002EEF0E4|nr:ProQ/FinO family protein [Cupriavidus sp. BIS7]